MASILTNQPVRAEQHFRMSYDEYAQRVDSSAHSEWVDGEVTIFMPPTERHQRLHGFLFGILLMFVQATERGLAFAEPFEMRLRSGRSYREPDILVVLSEQLDQLDGRRLNGPAALVVEILSTESLARDRREKYLEYEAGGVPEYWVVDGRDGSGGVVAYARNTEGRYEEIAPDEQGRIHSRVLSGFWADIAWLTANEPPNAYLALQEILSKRTAG